MKRTLSILLSIIMLLSIGAVTTSAFAVTKPATVQGLKATKKDCEDVKLTFKKVKGAKGYVVSYSTKKSGKYKVVLTTKKTKLTYHVKGGKTGYFKVRAYKLSGKKKIYSKYSKIVKFKSVKHQTGSWAVTKPATCGADGVKTATCKVCKAKIKAAIEATGEHRYNSGVVTTPATCTAEGVMTYTCQKCGKIKTSKIKATGHNYTSKTVEATCVTEGYTLYTCANCNDSYKTDVSPALGHSLKDAVVENKIEPTCTTSGSYEKNVYCSRCNALVSSDKVVINALGHNFSTGTICVSNNDGTHTSTTKCSRCSEVKIETKNCSYLDEPIVVADKTKEGLTKHTCVECGYSYEETVAKVDCDHTGEKTYSGSKAATCTEKGLTNATYCAECGTLLEASSEINPLGHDYQLTSTTATCTADGTNVYTCSRCNDSYTEAQTALGHDYVDGVDANGFATKTCSRCGKIKTDKTVYIDLTNKTVNASSYASFTTDSGQNKLVLTYDGSDTDVVYELTGSASDLTIDINTTVNVEITLNGVTITNASADIINLNDVNTDDAKAVTDYDAPKVSITAKAETTNTLTTTTSGNAIDVGTKLELKGKGVLNLNTVSTAIANSTAGKITIKNLTLNITSSNRGIDTKYSVQDGTDTSGNPTYSEEYANISIEPNATIVINSTDDGVRCKNLEFTAFTYEEDGVTTEDVDSTLNITSTSGDGIQLEGSKGLTMASGQITISAAKYGINNKNIAVSDDAKARISITSATNAYRV